MNYTPENRYTDSSKESYFKSIRILAHENIANLQRMPNFLIRRTGLRLMTAGNFGLDTRDIIESKLITIERQKVLPYLVINKIQESGPVPLVGIVTLRNSGLFVTGLDNRENPQFWVKFKDKEYTTAEDHEIQFGLNLRQPDFTPEQAVEIQNTFELQQNARLYTTDSPEYMVVKRIHGLLDIASMQINMVQRDARREALSRPARV